MLKTNKAGLYTVVLKCPEDKIIALEIQSRDDKEGLVGGVAYECDFKDEWGAECYRRLGAS